MKIFFIVVLVLSILFPPYMLVAGLGVMAHNQYEMRVKRLDGRTPMTGPSAHLGLTPTQLSGLDELVVSAYTDAVHDGYRLGRGFSILSLEALVLDAVLFFAAIFGLSACRARSRLTMRSS
jgi:hypothetical protein